MERFVQPTTFERLLLILLYCYDGFKFFSHRSGGVLFGFDWYHRHLYSAVVYSIAVPSWSNSNRCNHNLFGLKGLLLVEPNRSTDKRNKYIGIYLLSLLRRFPL